MPLWMICYDISDARRRRDLAELLMESGAERVQESVFEGWFSQREVIALYARAARLVAEESDRLRAYPVAGNAGGRLTLGAMPATARRKEYWQC